jgi:hypothetical protein
MPENDGTIMILRCSFELKIESIYVHADPDPGSEIGDPVPFWPLESGSGMGKKSRSGSGVRIRDEHPGSYFLVKQTILFG